MDDACRVSCVVKHDSISAPVNQGIALAEPGDAEDNWIPTAEVGCVQIQCPRIVVLSRSDVCLAELCDGAGRDWSPIDHKDRDGFRFVLKE